MNRLYIETYLYANRYDSALLSRGLDIPFQDRVAIHKTNVNLLDYALMDEHSKTKVMDHYTRISD
jgi:hypothetical protein